MHFLYACNEGFSDVLKTSVESLLELHGHRRITVHVVGEGLSDQTCSEISAMFESSSQTVVFVPMPNYGELLGGFIDPKRFSYSAFSRLFVDDLVGHDVERVIYLDCDTIVTAPLDDLWDFELNGAVIGAVDDCRNWRYLRNLGLPSSATYINSGVLLIDVIKFREESWQKEFREGMVAYNGLLEFPDNDLICMLMQDRLAVLPPKYNMISPARFCSYRELSWLRRPHDYYDLAEIEDAVRAPSVVHYTTFFGVRGRPWMDGYDAEDAAIFRRYFDLTGGRLRPAAPEGHFRRVVRSFLHSPARGLVLFAVGTIHGIVKPNLERRRRRALMAVKVANRV